MAHDFIPQGTIAELDPDMANLLKREDERQRQTIILIPSESEAPPAVNEALMTSFSNVYAEGYPREESRRQTQAEILDFDAELAQYRRNSDPRYYKGVEYADVLEALTRRRAAELFAANGLSADDLFVNVQPLSGAPANNAVYTALLKPGDTIMGLNLNDGGHLSHGAPVNRTGQLYNSVPYFVDPQTEALDYDAIEAQVLAVKPNIIVAGYSAYPLVVDWSRFRAMADKVGAYFLADVAHISGLVAAGLHPSPIGIADVVTTTTHKSLTGPRGAMIMTHRADLAKRIDRAVFPGEQGGPHLNTMAALAVALKLNASDNFLQLQKRIIANADRLAEKLQEHGLRVVGGGSQNHLLLVDAKSVAPEGVELNGDMAARILDIVGIVTNRNTIPGDRSAFAASGVRIGTVWISQRGFGDKEIDLLAEAMAVTLKGCLPFFYAAPGGRRRRRAKVAFAAIQRGREIVAYLTGQIPAMVDGDRPGYLQAQAAGAASQHTLTVRGPRATEFLDAALSSDVAGLDIEATQETALYGPNFTAAANLLRAAADQYYLRLTDAYHTQAAAEYLRDLSDGYVEFSDHYAKLPGPVVVKVVNDVDGLAAPADALPTPANKPFFVGQTEVAGEPLPAFVWNEPEDAPIKTTGLHAAHIAMGAKMVPFGGYDMPVWYSNVSEEHNAVRTAAGLFDVTHMGSFDVRGPHAEAFLQLVTSNDVATLSVGESQYTYLFAPDGSVIDDLLVYRVEEQRYLMVVNASNNDKDWAWLNAVNEGKVAIDLANPAARIQNRTELRDLRAPSSGADQLLDVALQGPASRDILISLSDAAQAKALKTMGWARLMTGELGGIKAIISRTGYTGERVGYELFVHPDDLVAFWEMLVKAGEPFGLKPAGLAARDSTRTEAGLPLYGHELAGPFELNPSEAGFASFVKTWKPYFIGRSAFIAHEDRGTLVRFRLNDKGVRRPETGDPVLDRRGKIVGHVTSCAIDNDGYLLGLAIVPAEFAEVDSSLLIYQTGGGSRPIKASESVALGQRLPVPAVATVLTRFPEAKK
ncbi:MAG: glycine cleavage system aminomethyltransferase GcvT [Ardenticatenales bacterium]|nr:glycine cleavage system aminomethyltransferase GcvT [Ardenticatenales bacterium]